MDSSTTSKPMLRSRTLPPRRVSGGATISMEVAPTARQHGHLLDSSPPHAWGRSKNFLAWCFSGVYNRAAADDNLFGWHRHLCGLN